MKRVLHVGCAGHPLPAIFGEDVIETRLDIDRSCNPDIVASMTDMGDIGPFEIVYCSHALEHLYPHEVPIALAEFHRVLMPGGAALIMVPDLEDVRPDERMLYLSPEGPVTGMDLIYGLRWTIEQSVFWAHHTGFTAATLQAALEKVFPDVKVKREDLFNLFGVGVKAL
jgi:SAM-dependent methyltransferase